MTRATVGGINSEDNLWYPLAVNSSGQAEINLDSYTNINNYSINSIIGTFQYCNVTTKLASNRPDDAFFKNNDCIGIGNYGYFTSSGSFGVSLVCGGYRSDLNTWISTAPGGSTGATALYLDPQGTVSICTDNAKATGEGSYYPTQRLIVNESGIQATGSFQAQELVCRKSGGGYAQIIVLADGTVVSADVSPLRNDARFDEIQADTQ